MAGESVPKEPAPASAASRSGPAGPAVPQPGAVLGLREIAVLLETDVEQVEIWSFREQLPVADFASVSGAPAWKRSSVLTWARANSYLPESLAPEPEAAGSDATPAGPDTVAVLTRLDELREAVLARPQPTDRTGEVLTALRVIDAAVAGLATAESVATSAEAFRSLEAKVADSLRVVDHNKEMIDRLHAENQRLRSGELTQALAPILRDLIRLYDQVVKLDESSAEPGKSDAAILVPQIVEILARSGVEVFTAEAGAAFDPALHQGIKRVPTTDASADSTIARARKAGFMGPDDKVMRAADVEVWRFEIPAPEPVAVSVVAPQADTGPPAGASQPVAAGPDEPAPPKVAETVDASGEAPRDDDEAAGSSAHADLAPPAAQPSASVTATPAAGTPEPSASPDSTPPPEGA